MGLRGARTRSLQALFRNARRLPVLREKHKGWRGSRQGRRFNVCRGRMVVLRAAPMGQVFRYMRFVTLLAVLPLLAACLPSAGPGTQQVVSGAGQSGASPFDVLELDQEPGRSGVVTPRRRALPGFRTGGAAPNLVIGVGDVVAVTIYEAASGGLFSGEAGRDRRREERQPAAAAGVEVGHDQRSLCRRCSGGGADGGRRADNIEAALRDKAIEPQVMVTLTGERLELRDGDRRGGKPGPHPAQSRRRPGARRDRRGRRGAGAGL